MWVFRLKQEQKVSSSSYFLTLTYNEQNLPHTPCGRPTLYRRDHQLFMKRLRKREKGAKIKYYAVGEYGSSTERPHYHSIIFNVQNVENIYKSWEMGHVRIDECNGATMAYVAKYVNKQTKFKDRNDPRTPEFSNMSRGLGLSYLTPQMKKYMKSHLNPWLTLEDGLKMPIPRYYKDKTFTDTEKNIIAEKGKTFTEQSDPFNGDFKLEHEWKKDQYRKRDKYATLKRAKL